MEQDLLIQISSRIRELRREKGITVQELADKAAVTKSWISQIENGRTIPSLMVLIDIIHSLDLSLDKFFSTIKASKDKQPVLVKQAHEYEVFEKEHTVGFHYRRIFTQSIKNSTVDIVLLELEPHAKRPLVQTEAFEYKYIISGKAKFVFDNQELELKEGDSILFDGRLPHSPVNMGRGKLQMLCIYFFEME
jgi:transcriptional regulator with XRE-family HTH domain